MRMVSTIAGGGNTPPAGFLRDDRNGRPASQVSLNSSLTESGSCKTSSLPGLGIAPPGRPYKANVDGSIPSAPAKINNLVVLYDGTEESGHGDLRERIEAQYLQATCQRMINRTERRFASTTGLRAANSSPAKRKPRYRPIGSIASDQHWSGEQRLLAAFSFAAPAGPL